MSRMIFCGESTQTASRISLTLPDNTETVVEINPGEAFGTGNQPSTKLCIQELQNIVRERGIDNVLDVGCGTGVLAICAIALGANRALALDVDPIAFEEAKINVETNGFSSKIRIGSNALKDIDEKFDLVLANLSTTGILNQSEDLKYKLKDNGLLLVAGIWFVRQEEDVLNRFRELSLSPVRKLYQGGWVSLLFKQD